MFENRSKKNDISEKKIIEYSQALVNINFIWIAIIKIKIKIQIQLKAFDKNGDGKLQFSEMIRQFLFTILKNNLKYNLIYCFFRLIPAKENLAFKHFIQVTLIIFKRKIY